MTVRRDRPFVWLTWLARIMSGEKSCRWASWFRANYQGYASVESDFDRALWGVKHAKLLDEVAGQCEERGETVRVQEQNRFWYERPSGLVLKGVPDLVSLSKKSKIGDVKTGVPKISDQVQVMLSMHFLPICRPEYAGISFEGCVDHPSSRIVIPASAVDEEFKSGVDHFLDMLESPEPPRRAPSELECRFCDITSADCPERIEGGAERAPPSSSEPSMT